MQLSQILKTWQVAAGQIYAELFGGLILNGPLVAPNGVFTGSQVALTYGAAIALNAAAGSQFVVNVTDGVAYAFSAPSNTPATGQARSMTITIRNTSGGGSGIGSFDPLFKVATTMPSIASNKSRTIQFLWNGTNYVEDFRSAADVAN